MSTVTDDDIVQAERVVAAMPGSGTHNGCRRCEDWGTVVVAGAEIPCKACRLLEWRHWRVTHAPRRDQVVYRDGVAVLVVVEAQPCADLERCPLVLIATADGAVWESVYELDDGPAP